MRLGKGANDAVGEATIKSGKGDVKNIAPKSRLLELWVGYRTMPAPGSLSEAFHGATATYGRVSSG